VRLTDKHTVTAQSALHTGQRHQCDCDTQVRRQCYTQVNMQWNLDSASTDNWCSPSVTRLFLWRWLPTTTPAQLSRRCTTPVLEPLHVAVPLTVQCKHTTGSCFITATHMLCVSQQNYAIDKLIQIHNCLWTIPRFLWISQCRLSLSISSKACTDCQNSHWPRCPLFR